MPLPSLTVNIIPPLPSDTPAVFNSRAFAAWAQLASLVPEIDAWSAQVDALASAISSAASAAAASASAASGSAGAAATSATNAGASATAASGHATTATNAATTATAQASAASGHATTASNAASAASTSATNAGSSASAAGNAASTAATRANEAAASAITAGNAADTAVTKAGEASGSATTASNAASTATGAAVIAEDAANAATNAATTATTRAGEASGSASAAAQSAADAQAAAAQAAGGGEPTVLPGTADQYWDGTKTWRGFFESVRAATLAGLSTASAAAIAAGDTVLSALGKLQRQITDHVGAGGDAHEEATTSVAGFMSAADKTKLGGIATSATANATDAQLRDRSTHTGTQAISTVTELQTALDGKQAASASLTAFAGKSAPSGAVVGTTDTQTLTGKTITGLRETRVAMGAGTAINLANGNVFTRTNSGNTTFTVSSVPAAGTLALFVLDITNGGSGIVTWWASIKWPKGTAPALKPSGRDVLVFYTHDGGTTWNGFRSGEGMA